MRNLLGIADAFLIVSSRANEVEKSSQLVLNAIETFKRKNDLLHEKQASAFDNTPN